MDRIKEDLAISKLHFSGCIHYSGLDEWFLSAPVIRRNISWIPSSALQSSVLIASSRLNHQFIFPTVHMDNTSRKGFNHPRMGTLLSELGIRI